MELRHLCLLVAAGGMAHRKRGARLPSSVRVALYMLVAFAMRRGNRGRALLRGTPSRSHGYSSRDGRPQSHSMLLYIFKGHLEALLDILKDKRGLPYACCC